MSQSRSQHDADSASSARSVASPQGTAAPRTSVAPAPAAWEPTYPPHEIASSRLKTFKRGRYQLVLGCTAAGETFALDNRCPHEGYPLAQGDLQDRVLTCCWHNWKFDVRDGRCVFGGEDVRAYPTRLRDGMVEVDLSEPAPAVEIARLQTSIAAGLGEADVERTLRDTVRLLQLGYDGPHLLADLARYDAVHAPYGSTHVLPLAADCGRFLERYQGVEQARVIAPVLELCAEENARCEPRQRMQVHGAANLHTIREAAAAGDAPRAEALLRAAYAIPETDRSVEAWLYEILAEHLTDFGHPLIFMVKAQELLHRAPGAYAADIYAGLVHGIALATREDTLPYMRAYFEFVRGIEGELAGVWQRGAAASPAPSGRDAPGALLPVRDALLDGSRAAALQSTWHALTQGFSPAAVAQAIVAAAAHRLLRFDLLHDANPEVAENWLWATHRLTFASAVRNAVQRVQSPQALRFLFQGVAFIHSGQGMDGTHRNPAPEPSDVDGVLQAIGAKQPEQAACRALACASASESGDELRRALEDHCLDSPFVRPIFVAHAVKTVVAAFEERDAMPEHPDRDVAVAAAVRFLAAPVSEHRLSAAVRNAIDWVARGRMPRKLTQ